MNRKAIAIIRQSCSDSLAIANPMDGVFGSDTLSMNALGLYVHTFNWSRDLIRDAK